MIKIKSIVLVLIISAITALPMLGHPVQAHILNQDNGIYAILHIDPDDNPQAGTPTILLLTFGANDGTFVLGDCACNVSVQSNNQTIYKTSPVPAFVGSSYQAISKVTFPSIGIYQLTVNGSSKTHKFPNFSLNYVVRVSTSSQVPTKVADISLVVIFSIAGAVIFILVAMVAIINGGRYSGKQK